jgi:hypothetical protein
MMPRLYRNNSHGRVRLTTGQEEMIELMRKCAWVEVRMMDKASGRIQVWGWSDKPWGEGPSHCATMLPCITMDADGLAIDRLTYKDGRILGLTRDEIDHVNDGWQARWADWVAHIHETCAGVFE